MADDDRKDKRDAESAPDEDSSEGTQTDEQTDTDADEAKDGDALARDASTDEAAGESEGDDEEYLPAQLAHRRYVYAVFFALGISVAYFASKAGLALWHRLSQWTPKVGEPREDLVTPIAAGIAAVATFLIYRREDVRTLSDEVALELSKVEWPSREKVRRSTTIVVGATLGSSLAFWLYDIGTNRAVTFVTGSEHPVLYGLVAGLVIYLIRALGVRFLVGSS
jgi:preprotein translocase SecE subunit